LEEKNIVIINPIFPPGKNGFGCSKNRCSVGSDPTQAKPVFLQQPGLAYALSIFKPTIPSEQRQFAPKKSPFCVGGTGSGPERSAL
jgi:hypothetical protein